MRYSGLPIPMVGIRDFEAHGEAAAKLCAACLGQTESAPRSLCGSEPWLDGRYTLHALVGRGAGWVVFRVGATRGFVLHTGPRDCSPHPGCSVQQRSEIW
jgi:hypothetical protein